MSPATLDRTYRALSDPSRRSMLRDLAERPAMSVSELAAPLAIGLPAVMKHLGVLESAGLIERRKTGRVVHVTLVPDAMAEARAWIEATEAFWTQRLDRLAGLFAAGVPGDSRDEAPR